MIKISTIAVEQIQKQAKEAGAENMYLRIAAKKEDDGAIEHGMGFDDKDDEDLLINCEGVNVIVAPASQALLQDLVLDYVEIEPGEYNFIFYNPNDPRHRPVSS